MKNSRNPPSYVNPKFIVGSAHWTGHTRFKKEVNDRQKNRQLCYRSLSKNLGGSKCVQLLIVRNSGVGGQIAVSLLITMICGSLDAKQTLSGSPLSFDSGNRRKICSSLNRFPVIWNFGGTRFTVRERRQYKQRP